MTTPLVTFCVPTYNAGSMLARALDAIQAQSDGHWACLVADNGSTDDTLDIVRAVAGRDDRFRLLPGRSNLGATDLYSRLAKAVETPYMVWASFDDVYAPRWLDTVMVMDISDSAVAYTACTITDADDQEVGRAHDDYAVDQDDPWERYKTVIDRLDLCTAVHGLLDTEVARQAGLFRPWRDVGAFDCLFLAEMAVLGKWHQVADKHLFRRYRPPFGYTHASKMASLERQDCCPPVLTIPTVKSLLAHIDLVERRAPVDRRPELIDYTVDCWRRRWGQWMHTEMSRAFRCALAGYFAVSWRDDVSSERGLGFKPYVLADLAAAAAVLPEWRDKVWRVFKAHGMTSCECGA